MASHPKTKAPKRKPEYYYDSPPLKLDSAGRWVLYKNCRVPRWAVPFHIVAHNNKVVCVIINNEYAGVRKVGEGYYDDMTNRLIPKTVLSGLSTLATYESMGKRPPKPYLSISNIDVYAAYKTMLPVWERLQDKL